MELFITFLIVAIAAAIVARRCWRLFYADGKAGCGSGCGSCPAGKANDSKGTFVSLELSPTKRR